MAFVGEDAYVRLGSFKDFLVGDAGDVANLGTPVLAVTERGVTEDNSSDTV